MDDAIRPRRAAIIVLGIMFFYPLAGVAYQFLHYLLGLRRLGYDAYYVEDTLADVYDPTLNSYTSDARRNIAAVERVLERFGLGDRWAYHTPGGEWAGIPRERLLEVFRRADACLNVTGAHELRDEMMHIPRRLYVESDPFATQVRVAVGDQRTIGFLDAHKHFFSFGENIGRPGCGVPVGRYAWMPTRQPVYTDAWNGPPVGGRAYTTVTTWHNKGDGIAWSGERYYWTKDREFRKFLELPRRRDVPFELAASVEKPVRDLLRDHGWSVADAVDISSSTERYKSYIQESRAEFTVARDQYVRPHTGWFS